MWKLKVREFGKSLGVVLPEEVVKRLRIQDGGTLILIDTPNGDYWLTLSDPLFERQMAKAEEIMSRYTNTLSLLAN